MLTILYAQYSNPDHTAVLAMTEESGSTLIAEGKAEKWTALRKWVATGGVIAPFVQAAPTAERDLAAEFDALKLALIARNVISANDVAVDQAIKR